MGSALQVCTASEPDSASELDSSLGWHLWQAAVQLGRGSQVARKSRSFKMKKEPPPYLWKMGADLGW